MHRWICLQDEILLVKTYILISSCIYEYKLLTFTFLTDYTPFSEKYLKICLQIYKLKGIFPRNIYHFLIIIQKYGIYRLISASLFYIYMKYSHQKINNKKDHPEISPLAFICEQHVILRLHFRLHKYI